MYMYILFIKAFHILKNFYIKVSGTLNVQAKLNTKKLASLLILVTGIVGI